jgi:translation initiation factor 4B
LTPEIQGPADKEEVWTIGSKFKPTPNALNDELPSKFGYRIKGDMGPPKEFAVDESDWRNTARIQKVSARSSVSRRFNYTYRFMTLTFLIASDSSPPTPQLARKKLELLPRSGNASASPSPLSSPKMGPSLPATSNSRGSPFGAARYVPVSNFKVNA